MKFPGFKPLQKKQLERHIASLAQLVEHDKHNVGEPGFKPLQKKQLERHIASLAQLVEHDTLNVGV